MKLTNIRELTCLRQEQTNHDWSLDFMAVRTIDGQPIKVMVVIGEYTRQSATTYSVEHSRRRGATDVVPDLLNSFRDPEQIPSTNKCKMIAKSLRN